MEIQEVGHDKYNIERIDERQ